MKGINYITDHTGKKSAIVIDIDTYAEQLEDFLDGLEAVQRINEPHEDYKIVMERILQVKK
jgi:predicted DNA-binding protein